VTIHLNTVPVDTGPCSTITPNTIEN